MRFYPTRLALGPQNLIVHIFGYSTLSYSKWWFFLLLVFRFLSCSLLLLCSFQLFFFHCYKKSLGLGKLDIICYAQHGVGFGWAKLILSGSIFFSDKWVMPLCRRWLNSHPAHFHQPGFTSQVSIFLDGPCCSMKYLVTMIWVVLFRRLDKAWYFYPINFSNLFVLFGDCRRLIAAVFFSLTVSSICINIEFWLFFFMYANLDLFNELALFDFVSLT